MDNLSLAEQRAAAATKLEAFPVQLYEVRRTIKQVLDLFGRNNFFSQYTVHDFSHVEAMLRDVQWIIPDETKSALTSADWLMITLSIYFHDLGLIVTEKEFQNRDLSAFENFCQTVLFAKDDGQDYKMKVESLGPELATRLFYQEFVRHNHAKRVRAWIEGVESEYLGYAKAQAKEIDTLLIRLSPDFRRDLAIVCESHNLDDLSNFKKYKPFKPYGADAQESANLLFVAVVLRTADLLQITKQRAPSIMLRLINPTDPISQLEWTKQNGVTGVFPKPALNREGHADTRLQPNTIAVHAKFYNENGFFGLTSYLSYAEKQLQNSFEAVQKANVTIANKLIFPWRKIDDSEVEAVGFIPSPFEFHIDQRKILDLLTGHTLYNDSSVAIRELVQNSIDAVRLYHQNKNRNCEEFGEVKLSWDSDQLMLTIQDNGTGMTQDIIEKHLLNVGSSRYQDPKFKEENPDFSPISRFGIGVLSTFMVADSVQIVTFHEEEEEGREISLRSVHGKYLIRLLDRTASEEATDIGSHGTRVILRMRASAQQVDLPETLKRWVLFPRCKMTLNVDQDPPIKIGFRSPAEALQSYINTEGELGLKPELTEVCERRIGGVTLAFAMSYNTHFRDRSFVQTPQRVRYGPDRDRTIPFGICVEGIRVESTSPGFSFGSDLLSVADCAGPDAPRTNVARTALESEIERNQLASVAFGAYLEQVQKEIDRLQVREGFSLNYAVEQFPFIAGPLQSSHVEESIRETGLRKFPMFLLETDSGRKAVSALELKSEGGFWIVESQSMTSLIELLRQAPAHITCKQVATFSHFNGPPFPEGNLVTNAKLSQIAQAIVEKDFEICELRASIDDRRLDIGWRPNTGSEGIWLNKEELEEGITSEELRAYHRATEGQSRRHTRRGDIQVAIKDFPVSGLDQFFGVTTLGMVRLLPGTPISQYFAALLTRANERDQLQFVVFSDALMASLNGKRSGQKVSRAEVEYSLKELTARFDQIELDVEEFLHAVSGTDNRLSIFNPWSWRRAEDDDEYDY